MKDKKNNSASDNTEFEFIVVSTTITSQEPSIIDQLSEHVKCGGYKESKDEKAKKKIEKWKRKMKGR